MQDEDCRHFKHLCFFFSKQVKQLVGISYTPHFLVEVHCTFTRSFNEHLNSLSLRTLIYNTFIEGHPNFLQNIFLCCWNDFLPMIVYMYWRDFFALKPFHKYSLYSVCILPQPALYSQSAVCILHTVCILPLVRSLQSAVHSLRITLTGFQVT